jgi:hypothetical protein
VKKSKATVDEHLDAAFASLDDLTVRELEATAEAIGSRRHPLFGFSSIFRDVASAREGGWSTDIPRFTFGRTSPVPTSSSPAGSPMPAPFWVHVREALAERQP